jgi:hypothetical protein
VSEFVVFLLVARVQLQQDLRSSRVPSKGAEPDEEIVSSVLVLVPWDQAGEHQECELFDFVLYSLSGEEGSEPVEVALSQESQLVGRVLGQRLVVSISFQTPLVLESSRGEGESLRKNNLTNSCTNLLSLLDWDLLWM